MIHKYMYITLNEEGGVINGTKLTAIVGPACYTGVSNYVWEVLELGIYEKSSQWAIEVCNIAIIAFN